MSGTPAVVFWREFPPQAVSIIAAASINKMFFIDLYITNLFYFRNDPPGQRIGLRHRFRFGIYADDRVRDFAQVKGSGKIDVEIARFALEALNIDKYGLDKIDNKILLTIIDKFNGGPVGLTTIATALGEDAGTIEEVYEPFLIKEGFIKRTPRGREVTGLAYQHLGRLKPSEQTSLF
jgi:predicted transcriptional regulator